MLRVLIVDDEEWIRLLIRELLPFSELGLELVGEAGDAPSALALARSANPDIILVDVRMSGPSGLELIATLRAEGKTAECIVISGHDEFVYAREALRQGVGDYILKPVDAIELKAALGRSIARIERRAAAHHRITRLERDKKRLAREACPRTPVPGVASKAVNHRVREALDFIHARFNTPIGLEQAAEHAFVSPPYLSEIFKRETGMGFAKYLGELRMGAAERLLRERPDMRVADIAAAVGIADPDYFARVFRKRRGLAPSEYRTSEDPNAIVENN